MDKNKYYEIINEDIDAFKNAPIVYENNLIAIKYCVDLLPEIPIAWDKRPNDESSIKSLHVHHSAVWSSYSQQNRYARNRRSDWGKKKSFRGGRLSYTLGVHHEPELYNGKIVVYQFNDFDEVSWHSGGKGKFWSKEYRKFFNKWGGGKVNNYSIGVNLRGYFYSKWHPTNIPEKPSKDAIRRKLGHQLIWAPSDKQILALVGIHQMCLEKFDNYFEDSFNMNSIFGHKDTGKLACPGDLVQSLVESVRNKELDLSKLRDVTNWIKANNIPSPGYPTKYKFSRNKTVETKEVEYTNKHIQWLLVMVGYNLGKYGRNKDGVDGSFGKLSQNNLEKFERKYGLLTNGYPDLHDYETLVKVYKGIYRKEPDFDFNKSCIRRRGSRSVKWDKI